jgi:hypothetical protein
MCIGGHATSAEGHDIFKKHDRLTDPAHSFSISKINKAGRFQ